MLGLLLDREEELDTLARRVAAVRHGAGRVIVVEGLAGIGKSSLLAAVARSAAADGFSVLRARGGPLEQDAVWGIARQLLDPLRRDPAWDELTAGAAALARRALEPEAPEPALVADAMHAAAHGLVALVCNLGRRAPTLLVVDDLHWVDAPSLRWLAQLAHRVDEIAVGVLCAVRSGEPAADPELLRELLSAAPDPPIRPRPLGVVAALALVHGRLPRADAAFAQACHAVTGGNPFLLASLVAHLAAEGVLPDAATARRLEGFSPDRVARSIEGQLARLPDGSAGLATSLAVLGTTAPLRHAARLAGLDGERAAQVADALRDAGLLERADVPKLAHPLIAGTLYASLAPGERARRHADAARLLADEHADAEQVALHLLHTTPASDQATVAALRCAAHQASARGAPESAVRFLRRALAEPPRESAAMVSLELGLALAAQVQPDAADVLRDAVERAASPAERAEIALRGARALGPIGHWYRAVEICRLGLEHADEADPATAERLEAELITTGRLLASTVEEARRRLQAPQVRSSRLELWRINAAQQALYDGEPVDDVRATLEPALRSGVLDAEFDSGLVTGARFVLMCCDDLDAAGELWGALIDLARPKGWLSALAHGRNLRAMTLVRAGRIRDAEVDARLAFQFKLRASPTAALLWALHALVDALTEADRLSAADAALAAAELVSDPPAHEMGSAVLLQSRARLRLAQHRPADAYADLQVAAALWDELQVRNPALASWRVDAAEALTALGDPVHAGRHARAHLELAERFGTPGPRGAGLRALANAGDPASRVDLLTRAVGLLARSPAQLEHARALVDLGAALRRANRRADARPPLRLALDLAEREGMLLLARRARAELVASGARPRRNASWGPDALTPGEHRVATLAAQGLSNVEIAQRLSVTRRTVETHLTHTFRKLDIGSRGELAAQLDGRAEHTPPVLGGHQQLAPIVRPPRRSAL